MTPLGHKVLRELVLPSKRRTIENRSDMSLLDLMRDVHFFDCRAITEAALGLVSAEKSGDEFRQQVRPAAFLPAKNVWIEKSLHGYDFGSASLREMAFLLRTDDLGEKFKIYIAVRTDERFAIAYVDADVPLDQNEVARIGAHRHPKNMESTRELYLEVLGHLALINTPRIIGREQRAPHSGLKRDLVRQLGRGFVIHDWSKILLDVTIPVDAAAGEGSERFTFTGGRALHFVRAHLRVKNGRVELVSAHWRGDPALGFHPATYRVT